MRRRQRPDPRPPRRRRLRSVRSHLGLRARQFQFGSTNPSSDSPPSGTSSHQRQLDFAADDDRFEGALSRLRQFSRRHKKKSGRSRQFTEWVNEHRRLARVRRAVEARLDSLLSSLPSRILHHQPSSSSSSRSPFPPSIQRQQQQQLENGNSISSFWKYIEGMETDIRSHRRQFKESSMMTKTTTTTPAAADGHTITTNDSCYSDLDADPQLRKLFESQLFSIREAEICRRREVKERRKREKRSLRNRVSSLCLFLVRKHWKQNQNCQLSSNSNLNFKKRFEVLKRKIWREWKGVFGRTQTEAKQITPDEIGVVLNWLQMSKRLQREDRIAQEEYRSEKRRIEGAMVQSLAYSGQMNRIRRIQEEERRKIEEKRAKLRVDLAVLREQHAQRLRILNEQKKRETEAERERQRNIQRALERERERTNALLGQYHAKLTREEEERQRIRERTEADEARRKLVQGRHNRVRTEHRRTEYERKVEQQRIRHTLAEMELQQRNQRLDRLRRTVSDTVDQRVRPDADRARGATESSRVRKTVAARDLWRDRVHSYTSDAVFKDTRAKLLVQLQVAGLLQTRYAREMIATMGGGGRRDNFTTTQLARKGTN